MQNIFKSADSITEKQKAHGLSKNLVCQQSPSKGMKTKQKQSECYYNVD